MGIKKDLNLVGDQYQWLGSLFYFGSFSILIGMQGVFRMVGLTGLLYRIPGVGVPHQSPAAAVAVGKVLRCLYFDVGDYS